MANPGVTVNTKLYENSEHVLDSFSQLLSQKMYEVEIKVKSTTSFIIEN